MKNVGDLPEYPGLKAKGTLCYIKCLFIIVTRCTIYISISSIDIDIDFLNLGNFISLRGGKFFLKSKFLIYPRSYQSFEGREINQK